MGRSKFKLIPVIIGIIFTGCNNVPTTQHELRVALLKERKKEEKKVLLYDNQKFSFLYPDDWLISEMLSKDDSVRVILGERNQLYHIENFNLVCIKGVHNLQEIIDSFYSPFKQEFSALETATNNFVYNNVPCQSFDFRYSTFRKEVLYSRITAFNLDGHTFAILKQSTANDRLDKEFSVMEGSMKFNLIAERTE